MAPAFRADRKPFGSEPNVQTATPNGFIERQGVYITRVLSGLSIRIYHALVFKGYYPGRHFPFNRASRRYSRFIKSKSVYLILENFLFPFP